MHANHIYMKYVSYINVYFPWLHALRWQILSRVVDRFSMNVFGVSMAITKNNVKALYIIPGEPFTYEEMLIV